MEDIENVLFTPGWQTFVERRSPEYMRNLKENFPSLYESVVAEMEHEHQLGCELMERLIREGVET